MDPFIESQIWEDFHHALIEVIRESLIPYTRPRYVVRVEERVYDVTVLERAESEGSLESTGITATPVSVMPVIRHLPVPEQMHEAFLTIRTRETMEVITVIEVLSPGNKRAGSDGR